MNVADNNNKISNSYHSEDFDYGLFERLLFKLSKKWIVGSSSKDAINYSKFCNKKGIHPILNYLGEHTIDINLVNKNLCEYITLIDLLHLNLINGSISVKPSQLGLSISKEFCNSILERLAKESFKKNIFLWIDMESYQYLQDTLSIYLDLIIKYHNIGIVIQSNLKRSMSDILHLSEYKCSIRLVKGAYRENNMNAFHNSDQINANFIQMLEFLIENDSIEKLAIGTHDSKLIQKAIDLYMINNFDKKKLEFQFLKGIRDDLKDNLLKNGFIVCEYIPYGKNWIPYSIRRIKERKRNILLLGRSMLNI